MAIGAKKWKHRNKSQMIRLPTTGRTPTVDTPDRQRYAVASQSSQFADLDMHGLLLVYRRRCDHAAATLLLLLSRTGGGFVDISLVEQAPAIKRRVGVGLAGKGGMVGSGTKLSFGVIRSQWWCVAQQTTVKGLERWCWWSLCNPGYWDLDVGCFGPVEKISIMPIQQSSIALFWVCSIQC
eukprot:scaffold69822_cov50-Attheya_sp.AAC.1